MIFLKAILWIKSLFGLVSSSDDSDTSERRRVTTGGGWWRYLGVMALSGALCGLGVYAVMDWRIDNINEQLMLAKGNFDLAKQRADNAAADMKLCTAAVTAQNAAVEAMAARAKEAEAAMATANTARQTAEQRAADILRERTPAGADKCTAARNAFSEELRKERGQ